VNVAISLSAAARRCHGAGGRVERVDAERNSDRCSEAIRRNQRPIDVQSDTAQRWLRRRRPTSNQPPAQPPVIDCHLRWRIRPTLAVVNTWPASWDQLGHVIFRPAGRDPCTRNGLSENSQTRHQNQKRVTMCHSKNVISRKRLTTKLRGDLIPFCDSHVQKQHYFQRQSWRNDF